MLKEYTIFDIPIYLMSESDYDKKINKECEEYCSKIIQRHNKNWHGEISHCLSEIKSFRPWRYNQIVGAIRISITNDECIELRLYFVDKKKINYNSKVKHMIKNCYISDLRVKHALSYRTNEALIEQLNSFIDYIIKNYVNNGSHIYFVDLELYNNLICKIDLRNLVVAMNS